MANKKISELPLISLLSGSTNATTTALNTVVPVVMYGTTNQITVENFSKLVTAYNATTASNHFKGSQFITGSLVVTGDITAERYYIETITSSVIYESGSTVFGNSGDDIHTFTGSIILNGSTIGFSQLNAQTASQDLVNRGISSVTGSINTTTSSFDNVFLGISSVTGSMRAEIGGIEAYTASLKGAAIVSSSTQISNYYKFAETASVNTFYGNQTISGSLSICQSVHNWEFGSNGIIKLNNGLGEIYADTSNGYVRIGTAAVNAAPNTQIIIGGPDRVFKIKAGPPSIEWTFDANGDFNLTGSINGALNLLTTASFNSFTQSLNTQTASQDLVNRGISSVTGSINTTTSSFDLVFRGISSVTGAINLTTSSLIGITNGLMAFTAALDSTYATDAQLYQLYQATASIHSTTQSLNVQTGSQDLVNLGISTFTGSQNVINSSVDSHILKQATQTGSQDLVNLGISTFTGSLRSEVNLIEAYTSSLKAAAIVSSSTQIQNYFLFAQTSSANTFYNGQTFKGNVNIHGGNTLRMYETTNTNYWDVYTYTDDTLRLNYKGVGNDEIILYNDGGISFLGAITGSRTLRIDDIALIGGSSQLQSAQLSVYGSVLARNGGVDASYQNAFLAQYSGNSNEANAILTAVSSVAAQSGFRFDVSDGGGSSARTTSMYVNRASVSVVGALSKGSGTFKIDHPLESKKDTHHLVHSFVEGPRADLIYRGKVTLVNGQAVINIDETVGMTEGTFVALNRDVQCFTTNESGWDLVKGKVVGNILTILSNNSNSTDEISWMVIGERQDEHIKNTEWTDANGKPILEPTKISGSIL